MGAISLQAYIDAPFIPLFSSYLGAQGVPIEGLTVNANFRNTVSLTS